MMKRIFFLIALLFMVVFMANCSRENDAVPTAPGALADKSVVVEYDLNPPAPADLPAATVEIRPQAEFLGDFSSGKDGATLTPEAFSATLRAGECASESKLLHLPEDVAPALGDILFVMDLTGSMGGELGNVQVNSVNIMNAIRAVIPDIRFGLISHMDYVGTYVGCGYSASYGVGGDYPYRLDAGLTPDIAAVQAAIMGLSLGDGWDGPESYSRVLYESYSDPLVGWRPGATSFVLAWGDALPHDCAVDACLGGNLSTGPDPGRDGIVGTADDLEILEVLDGMAANGLTLISLFSGGSLALWDCYASRTGPDGAAFAINDDGTIPGGTDIAAYIAGLISDAISHIDVLTLDVCDPMYSDWLVSVSPASYTDIDLDMPLDFPFEIQICVPEGTPDGEYCFDVCALGDGNEYARQSVCITVVSEIEVAFDIHPTSCPNPVNFKSRGVVPAAILGTADFDVATIDPATIRLEGVAPVRWVVDDVATPFEPYLGRTDCYDCTTAGPDGYMDLTLKFLTQDLIAALGHLPDVDCMVLSLTAETYDGIAIVGEDVIKLPVVLGDVPFLEVE
ncbi:MAG: VWA domain-containing protein [Candidatus Krumholzibacteriia bacterium]